MSKENDEKVVQDIIEYANHEIKKSKKKYLIITLSILGVIAIFLSAYLLVFEFEVPVAYVEDMIEVNVPVDKGLDVKINLSNYKNAKAVLVKTDEDSYDLYICITQTLFTKLFDDSDYSDNMLRVGNRLVVDFQSGLLRGHMPSGYSSEDIMHVYYIDNLTNEMMVKNDDELANYENKTLIWTRDPA